MRNPWVDLYDGYLLPEDQAILEQDKRFFEDRFKLQLQLPPVPFLNNPEVANVVILAKNPGYSPTNDADLESYPDLIPQNIAALTFDSECPFFYLDPRFQGANGCKGADGYVWWDKVLADVFRTCEDQHEISRMEVIERISCVQWYPYHSNRSIK